MALEIIMLIIVNQREKYRNKNSLLLSDCSIRYKKIAELTLDTRLLKISLQTHLLNRKFKKNNENKSLFCH